MMAAAAGGGAAGGGATNAAGGAQAMASGAPSMNGIANDSAGRAAMNADGMNKGGQSSNPQQGSGNEQKAQPGLAETMKSFGSMLAAAVNNTQSSDPSPVNIVPNMVPKPGNSKKADEEEKQSVGFRR